MAECILFPSPFLLLTVNSISYHGNFVLNQIRLDDPKLTTWHAHIQSSVVNTGLSAKKFFVFFFLIADAPPPPSFACAA